MDETLIGQTLLTFELNYGLLGGPSLKNQSVNTNKKRLFIF